MARDQASRAAFKSGVIIKLSEREKWRAVGEKALEMASRLLRNQLRRTEAARSKKPPLCYGEANHLAFADNARRAYAPCRAGHRK